jgi:isopropylmalate/homocitrate/citramalate synthase
MNKPWVKNQSHVSLYNFTEEVRAQMDLPKRVIISDCTLREGEQQAGVILDTEEKLRLAHALDELGITELEVGNVSVSHEVRAAVEAIARAGLKAKIRANCLAVRSQIDIVRDCGASMISIALPSGYLQLESKLKWSQEKTIETAVELSNYAHQQGLEVLLSPFDTTRSDPDFLERYLRTVATEGHVDRIRVFDTVGCAIPLSIKSLVRKVKEFTQLPIEIHCHNNLGLATANTLAAVEAGVDVVDTALNGMGEGTGNAPTEEVALVLQLLYDIDVGLKFDRLYEASRLLQQLTGIEVQKHKAVVGENAFAIETGTIVAGWMANPFTAFPFLAEYVGQNYKVMLGKWSGRSSITWRLKELGLAAAEEQIADIVKLVKEEAERTKASVSDETFRRIVDGVIS